MVQGSSLSPVVSYKVSKELVDVTKAYTWKPYNKRPQGTSVLIHGILALGASLTREVFEINDFALSS